MTLINKRVIEWRMTNDYRNHHYDEGSSGPHPGQDKTDSQDSVRVVVLVCSSKLRNHLYLQLST